MCVGYCLQSCILESFEGFKLKCHTSAKFWYIGWFKIAHLDFSANQSCFGFQHRSTSRVSVCVHMCTHSWRWLVCYILDSLFLSLLLTEDKNESERTEWIMDRLEVMEMARPWDNVVESERSKLLDRSAWHRLLDWVGGKTGRHLYHSSVIV